MITGKVHPTRPIHRSQALLFCADVGPSPGGTLVSQNCAFWSAAAMIWSPSKLRSSLGYFLIWRMPRALVAGSMIQAAQAKPMSAMPSSVLSHGVS